MLITLVLIKLFSSRILIDKIYFTFFRVALFKKRIILNCNYWTLQSIYKI